MKKIITDFGSYDNDKTTIFLIFEKGKQSQFYFQELFWRFYTLSVIYYLYLLETQI